MFSFLVSSIPSRVQTPNGSFVDLVAEALESPRTVLSKTDARTSAQKRPRTALSTTDGAPEPREWSCGARIYNSNRITRGDTFAPSEHVSHPIRNGEARLAYDICPRRDVINRPPYTGVRRSTLGYTGVHTGIHWTTQKYTGVHRGTLGYTGVR